jgi:hypothetical protein
MTRPGEVVRITEYLRLLRRLDVIDQADHNEYIFFLARGKLQIILEKLDEMTGIHEVNT